MIWTTVKHRLIAFDKDQLHLNTKIPHPLADAFLYLATSYNKFLPTATILELLFTHCPELMDLAEYTQQVYDVVPETSLYCELVWPAPRHYSFQSHQGFDKVTK